MNALMGAGQAKITSREIAELVDSRHDDVKRSIDRLANQGVIESPPTAEIPTATRPATVYVFSGDQGKRDSIVVVAQLSPEFTARLVDRWQELEGRAQGGGFAIPQTMGEALRLAADLSDQCKLLESKVEEQAPKAAFHDQVVAAPDAISMGEAAKILGTGRTRLMALLRQMRWLTRHNEPYQERIEAGLMDVKLSKVWDHPEQGLKRTVTPLMTGKGLVKLKALGVGRPVALVAA